MSGLPLATSYIMGLGRKLSTILSALLFCSYGYGALMPLGEGLFSESKVTKTQSINVLDWIERRQALDLERAIDINHYINVSKIEAGMSEGDITKNLLLTSIKNADFESLRNVTTKIKEVEKVTSAAYSLSENAKNPTQLKMSMDLIRAEAKVKFNGPIDAELNYEMNSAELRVEFSKDVEGTRYLAEHTQLNGESKNTLGVRWNF